MVDNRHDETVTFTHKELTVLSDVVRRVQAPPGGRDLADVAVFRDFPEFATAAEKIDDAFMASLGEQAPGLMAALSDEERQAVRRAAREHANRPGRPDEIDRGIAGQ